MSREAGRRKAGRVDANTVDRLMAAVVEHHIDGIPVDRFPDEQARWDSLSPRGKVEYIFEYARARDRVSPRPGQSREAFLRGVLDER